MFNWLLGVLGAGAVWLGYELLGEAAFELVRRALAPVLRPAHQALSRWCRRARTPLPLLGVWVGALALAAWGYQLAALAPLPWRGAAGIALFLATPVLALLLTFEWRRARRGRAGQDRDRSSNESLH